MCFVGTGVVTAEDLCRATLALSKSKEVARRITFGFVDFEAVTRLQLDTADLRRLVEIDLQLAALVPDAVVAIAAPKDHMYGLARMWEVLAEETGWKTGVFRSSREACLWVIQNGVYQH